MRTILILSMLFALNSFGAEYELFYLADGKRVTADIAILKSIDGANVYKCQSVETKVSKSGTSISLRNVKKPKSETKD